MFSTAGCTGGDIPIVLECLDVMVNKRKRQVSNVEQKNKTG